jgi:hypothetical protein
VVPTHAHVNDSGCREHGTVCDFTDVVRAACFCAKLTCFHAENYPPVLFAVSHANPADANAPECNPVKTARAAAVSAFSVEPCPKSAVQR